MTPAVAIAKKAGIFFRTHQYAHDPNHESYGEEAAEKLAVDPARVFKTLVVSLDRQSLVVAVLPVADRLDMKAVARILKQKRAEMAEAGVVQRATGYVLGGVSPLGQKRRLPTLINDSARNFETVYVSAGRRGLELELRADDLGRLLGAHFGIIVK